MPVVMANSTLGSMLRMARTEQRWSQQAVGLKLDPPAIQSTVSTWETGKVIPSIPHLLQLADVFGFDYRGLFDAAIYDYEASKAKPTKRRKK